MNQPNVLLVVCDQMTPLLTGAYGHPVVQTPHLGRLAAEGVRYDAAYTPCPLCAPVRACLATGTHVSTNKAWDNAAPVAAELPTFAHHLGIAGYHTATSGKWHFIGPDQLHGFAQRLTTDVYPAGMRWLPAADRDPRTRVIERRAHADSYRLPNVGPAVWNRFLAYDEEVHFRALEYLREQAMARAAGEANRPFLLCVSYHHPHEPFRPTRQMWDRYQGAEIEIPDLSRDLAADDSAMDRWLHALHGTDHIDITAPDSLRALRRAYYALVSYIDDKVGELLAAVDAVGLSDDTVVIFTSDHGDMLGERNMVQKRCFYEMSARIPLIMRFPDRRHAGRVVAGPVSLLDIPPTLYELAGVAGAECDGVSLIAPLAAHEGAEDAVPERLVFSESHSAGVYEPCFMVRDARFKYVHIRNEQPQLFDLEEDPEEWRNLADDAGRSATVERLRAALLDRFDPDAIEEELRRSLARRQVIKRAHQHTPVSWDHQPLFDAATAYVR